MFCPKCGNNLPDGATFCPKCGKQLEARPEDHQATHDAPIASAPMAAAGSQDAGRGGFNPKIAIVVAVIVIALAALLVRLFACSGSGELASDSASTGQGSPAEEVQGIPEDSFFLGKWELGEISIDDKATDWFQANTLELLQDGTAIMIDGGKETRGTWEQSGSTASMTIGERSYSLENYEDKYLFAEYKSMLMLYAPITSSASVSSSHEGAPQSSVNASSNSAASSSNGFAGAWKLSHGTTEVLSTGEIEELTAEDIKESETTMILTLHDDGTGTLTISVSDVEDSYGLTWKDAGNNRATITMDGEEDLLTLSDGELIMGDPNGLYMAYDRI